jgi:hypothetical protein
MEGDTVRLKNIPADADKVQVLRNFNEVSQMKGLETTTMILRLTSNSKKDKFWFGISAGLANDKGYILIQSIFYSPKPV